MSGVRAANSISPDPSRVETNPADPEVAAMQDVLYDILANGMDPDRADVPTQEVERFLFEHARAPKSRDEFRAFFAAHALSLTTSRAEAGLVLPPIERSPERDMPARLPVELSTLAQQAPESMFESFEITETRVRKPARAGLFAVLSCAIAAVGCAAYYGYTTIDQLQHELERTAARGLEQQQALDLLRDRAAGLESSVAATGELVQRMDQKSDLLIDSLLPPEAPPKSVRKRR